MPTKIEAIARRLLYPTPFLGWCQWEPRSWKNHPLWDIDKHDDAIGVMLLLWIVFIGIVLWRPYW